MVRVETLGSGKGDRSNLCEAPGTDRRLVRPFRQIGPAPFSARQEGPKLMDAENRCPACNAELAANAPRGLCPACLLKGGLGTQTGGSNPSQGVDFVLPTPAELAPHFPDLEILELVGRGGMGVVYKARQKRLDRLVALKILSPKIGQDPAFAERFAREARAMAMLSHPHVVAVYDFGQTKGERREERGEATGRRGARGRRNGRFTAHFVPSPAGRGPG